MRRAILVGVLWLASALPAAAELSATDRARLHEAVERCGRLNGIIVQGEPLLEAGPFLSDLIGLAEKMGATVQDRQFLRIDFSQAAERMRRGGSNVSAEELKSLRQQAETCRDDAARR